MKKRFRKQLKKCVVECLGCILLGIVSLMLYTFLIHEQRSWIPDALFWYSDGVISYSIIKNFILDN